MDKDTQAKAEQPATAAPEKPEAGTSTTEPTLEGATLADMDNIQKEAADSRPAVSGEEGKESEVETPPAVTGEEATTETPPVEEAPAEEPETVTAEGEEPAKEEAKPEEPSGEIPERFRFKDPTDRAIAAVYKAAQVTGSPISWAEAEKRVKGEATTVAPQVDPFAAVSSQIDTLRGEIAGLEAQIDPADEGDEILSSKEMRAATVQLSAKRAELAKAELKLENVEERIEGERLANLDAQTKAREVSKNRAIAEYPDAADADTRLGKAISKRFEEMKNPRHPDHPILYADTAPERVTEIVAKELGIAAKPKTPTAKPATTPTAPQKKATPVSGVKTSVPEKPAEVTDDKTSVEYLLGPKSTLEDLDKFTGANEGIAAAVR